MTRGFWRQMAATALGVLAGTVAAAGTASVAVAGFTLSYDAIRRVGIAAFVRPDWAWLLPVSVDGAMAVATVTAVVMGRMDRKAWYPWLVVVAGAGISVGCNALHAYMRGGALELDPRVAMAVSAIPAVMLALSVHLLVVLVDAAARVFGPPDHGDQITDQGDRTTDQAVSRSLPGRPLVAVQLPPVGNGYRPSPAVAVSAPDEVDQAADQAPDLDIDPDQAGEQGDDRPRPDADLVAEFRDQIMAGPMTRGSVERITRAHRRQAQRILDQIISEGDQATDQDALVGAK